MVKSLYLDNMSGHAPFLRRYIWNIKVPLKIKKFIWSLNQMVILTEDNFVKRKWEVHMMCSFVIKKNVVLVDVIGVLFIWIFSSFLQRTWWTFHKLVLVLKRVIKCRFVWDLVLYCGPSGTHNGTIFNK
jgi:hypothetical protein